MAHSRHLPSCRALLPWTLALFAATAFAQAPPDIDAPRPSLPTKLQYSSAIGAYQTYADQQVQSWREANDRVGQIGGWRAYAKEIRTGKDTAPSGEPHMDPHGGGVP